MSRIWKVDTVLRIKVTRNHIWCNWIKIKNKCTRLKAEWCETYLIQVSLHFYKCPLQPTKFLHYVFFQILFPNGFYWSALVYVNVIKLLTFATWINFGRMCYSLWVIKRKNIRILNILHVIFQNGDYDCSPGRNVGWMKYENTSRIMSHNLLIDYSYIL